jgi:hypothetical protein
LKVLAIEKARNISTVGFYDLFKNLNTNKLIKLNLNQANYVDDDALIYIFEKNKNSLRELNLFFCEIVGNKSIQYLFLHCKFLAEAHLEGLKHLNKEGFP